MAATALAACVAKEDPATAAAGAAGYRVKNGFIVDPVNRVLILRGFNYANDHKFPDAKTGTFFPAWESAKDFQRMAGWGFNSVRLLMTWEALEPERGQYDDAYVEGLRLRLDWAQAAGQLVVLDMHQDIYSRAFGGDGAPAWAVFTDGMEFTLQDPWYLNFAEPAVLRAMDNFFADKEGIRERFIDAWAMVAERLGDHPALIGFNFLNEPYPGSKAFALSAADEEILNPLYRDLVARIAKFDKTHLFFIEPNAVRTNALAGSFPSKLDVPPGAEGRLVFAPHLYDPVVTSTGKYDDGEIRLRAAVRKLSDEARRLDAALWIGEWSVWDGRVDGYDAFLRDQLAGMDAFLAGWSFWNFSLNEGDLTSVTQSPEFLHQLARPQLSALAGEPLEIGCAVTSCRFRYQEHGAGAPTEIWIPHSWSAKSTYHTTPERKIETRIGADVTILTVAAGAGATEITVDITK